MSEKKTSIQPRRKENQEIHPPTQKHQRGIMR